MKKTTKKIICLLTSVMLIISITAYAASAETDKTMNITVRIEGISQNFFYKTISVPYTDSLTLQAALQYIDTQEANITITGADTAYISDINGDSAATFGGWDGWMFKINGVEPSTGIDGCMLSDGDSVVLYYGDPFGVGMQFPVADTSEIAGGIIRFTSSDTTYDTNYNPTTTVNPVTGATVTFKYGNETATYTTDEKGEIKIDAAQLTEGTHGIQISKTGAGGIPLVLRFASDYTVTVPAVSSQAPVSSQAASELLSVSSSASSAVSSVQAETTNPKTADTTDFALLFAILSISVLCIFISNKGRQHTYEK